MTQFKQLTLGSRNTPMNSIYGTCERTCAKLQIYSGDMHPSVVTERLGIVPTSVIVKGEFSPRNSRGLRRVRVGKINGWFLSSEDFVPSKDVRHHLDWILERLEAKKVVLLELQDVPGVKMFIFCPWWSKHGQGGPTLWPEQMRGMAELNLECAFDFADMSEHAAEDLQSNLPLGAQTV